MGTWVLRFGRFAIRVVARFIKNKGLLLSSAVGYNMILSLIPMIAILTLLLSWVFDETLLLDTVAEQVRAHLPGQYVAVTDAVRRFTERETYVGWIGFGVMLFFSSIAFRILEDALSVIFRHHPQRAKRSFLVSTLLPLAYIGCIALALTLVAIATAVLGALSERELRLAGYTLSLAGPASWALQGLGFVLLAILFASFYRVMPAAHVRFRLALVGGLVAATLWEIVRVILTWYFATLSLVSVIYGSLATVVVILLCMEVASVILLLGAQVISEIERSWEAGVRWYEPPPGRTQGS